MGNPSCHTQRVKLQLSSAMGSVSLCLHLKGFYSNAPCYALALFTRFLCIFKAYQVKLLLTSHL